jgi:hypothetical protein
MKDSPSDRSSQMTVRVAGVAFIALLGPLLTAATHPQEVMDGGNYLLQTTLTGKELDADAEKAGFGPSTRALLQFPTVVDMMRQNFDWTQQRPAMERPMPQQRPGADRAAPRGDRQAPARQREGR